MSAHTLIIGSGLAGITLARELRKLDKDREIVVVTADDGSFYSKPNLSNAFAAKKEAADLLLMRATKLEMDLGIRILANTALAGIDPVLRQVTCPSGTLAYDELVLAVGASQSGLSLAGDGASDMLSVNCLGDYAELRRRLQGKRRVAIIGAGLIGCEFANDMRIGGYAVDVFDIADRLLPKLLPPRAAMNLQDRLSGIGVVFHLSTQLKAMLRDEAAYLLIDGDGVVRRYDVVLSAIGLRPNLALAKSAGLATRVGVLTDRFLATSDPHIHALGDCSEVDGLLLPYVMPIMQGAAKLARTLSGMPEPLYYPAMPVVVKTPACPTVVSPPRNATGYWDETITEDGLRALFIDHDSGAPSGFVLQGAFTKERTVLSASMPPLLARENLDEPADAWTRQRSLHA